jgi:hypothetical protein
VNLLIIALLVAGYIFAWRRAFVFFINDTAYWGRPDSSDIVFAAIFSSLLSLIWPLWLVPAIMYHFIKPSLDAYIESKYPSDKETRDLFSPLDFSPPSYIRRVDDVDDKDK